MRNVLITAFEPFGKDTENAAAIVCGRIPTVGKNYRAVKRILPTEFKAGAEALLKAMEEEAPELVICLGQAAGRSRVTPEKVAVNLMDGAIPDNAGYQPDELPVIPGCPDAYFTNVPVKAAVQAAKEAGYPAAVSCTAGTYVCNCVFYTLMNRIACTPANEMTGPLWGDFIHIPYVAEQQGIPENVPTLTAEQAAATVIFLIEDVVDRMDRKS